MNKKKWGISIAVVVMLVFSAFGIYTYNSFFDPQTITVYVTDQNNMQLSNVSVQGVMPVPPTMGNGLETVFFGTTDQYGICTITNFSMIDMVAHAWRSYQGNIEFNASSPNILLFMTYQNNKGVFLTSGSVPLSSNNLLNGKSFNGQFKINTSANPDFPNINLSNAVKGPSPLLGTPLPPYYHIGGAFYWTLVNHTIWPSQNSTGKIPIGWITVQGTGPVNCTLAISLFSQSNEYVNVGIATDVNVPGATVGYKTGGSIWQTNQSYAGGANTPTVTPGNSVYLYIVGQLEGGLYQLVESTLWGWYYFDNYMYETGIVNIPIDLQKNIEMGYASGLPPQISTIDLNYSYNLFTELSPGENNKTYSTQFVADYTSFDSNWINIGVPVGSILQYAKLLSSNLASVISLACAVTFNTQTTTGGLGWVQYGVNDQNYLYAYVMVGNTIYNLGNGATGIVPLMGIDIQGVSASGGGGCVLYNTNITLANGSTVPVQNLNAGSEILSYNYNTKQYENAIISSVSYSNVSNIIDINNGLLYMSGLEDQPMLVKMQDGIIEATTLGMLNSGMQVYLPLLSKWLPVTNIKLLTGNFTVYDIRTMGNVDYIANGVLIIPK